ncbi:GNAT family N-acetyltransferase [Fulvivirga sp. M361]|uniref:GNAT family N-acetyltransferase n=1 Tax=Fulvivirga sp. M361 TaxID=2594266 RepID=UPI00117B40BA|nr:GNAT family N-acetyltransferase [Fulvivirga sp. M361]TRX48061.1 GNAT family N-acetyltransferase [Fulvivirga sp. M361]
MLSSNVIVHKLDEHDFEKFVKVIRLFERVFEMENFSIPPLVHLQKLLSKHDFFVFVALQDGIVTGGLTAYVLEQYYSEKPLAYIYDLAVDTPYQRQGIGKALIEGMNHFCQEKGFEEVFVQADKAEDDVIDFYRSTLPTEEEQVVHFYYTLDKNK